jgi:hypothetical protein
MALLSGAGTGTTSAAALGSGGNCSFLEIRNTHASAALYVGPAGVTTANGHKVPSGATVRIDGPVSPTGTFVVGDTATFTWIGNT